MRTLFAMIALALAALPIAGVDAAAARKPKLKQCPALQPLAADSAVTPAALAIPKSLRKIAVAAPGRLAVSTIGGSTICVDMRLRAEVSRLEVSADRRFVSFDWAGYENAGHVVVDRSGIGQQTDFGSRPAHSPSRQRMAAVNQEDGIDSDHQALAVWLVQPVGMRRLGDASELPNLADWRIDGWVLEDCIDMSAIPLAKLTRRAADIADSARERYMAAPYGNAWRVVRTTRGCAAG